MFLQDSCKILSFEFLDAPSTMWNVIFIYFFLKDGNFIYLFIF